MEEKKEQVRKTSVKSKSASKAKVKKTVPKKEYLVVLIKQSSLILSFDGTNTRIAKTKEHEGLAIGDALRL